VLLPQSAFVSIRVLLTTTSAADAAERRLRFRHKGRGQLPRQSNRALGPSLYACGGLLGGLSFVSRKLDIDMPKKESNDGKIEKSALRIQAAFQSVSMATDDT
jgi:hypothetical protein